MAALADERTRQMRPSGATVGAKVLDAGSRVGDWTIVRELGGGGFGTVYEAAHHATAQRVALKVLHAHLVATPEIVARFGREISVLQRLSHPNVVTLVDAGIDRAGRSFLAMELLVGNDLARVIEERGQLPPHTALAICRPLCDAIAAAHDLGIIHRDLKASNVFLCDDDRVVLLDFGIAKLSDALGPELTASHQSLGTPGTMAPEQIQGGSVDLRTDVYALGCMLFHMLTGRLPFHDPSETMTQYLHLHGHRPKPSALVPMSKRIDDVVSRAMAIEPSDRFENARAFLAATRAAMRETQVHAVRQEVEHAAIFASVDDRSEGADVDARLYADLEAVLPAIERHLGERGFMPALDLGSSAVFVAPNAEPGEAVRAALATWDQLEQRADRDPRVRIGLVVHRGTATVRGNEIDSPTLLRPETWGMPEPIEGVWVTGAIEPAMRRLR